jgi:hypothetical protein
MSDQNVNPRVVAGSDSDFMAFTASVLHRHTTRRQKKALIFLWIKAVKTEVFGEPEPYLVNASSSIH